MKLLFFFGANSHYRLLKSVCNQSIQRQFIQLILILCSLIILHIGMMVYFENLKLGDAVWLTLTTVTTVGYGDLSATTFMGRTASIILMYVAGIAILAQVVALFFEYRQDSRNRILSGNWNWNMHNHIVFLNCPKENHELFFYQTITQLRQSNHSIGKKPVIIVGDNMHHGISNSLRNLDVAHIHASPTSETAFVNSSLDKASIIIILSLDDKDPLSDSLNFDLISRAREKNPNALIIAEAISDSNRQRLQKIGANHVMRPLHTYPEILVRTMIAPGSEQVIENLFNSSNEQCFKYNVNIKQKWGLIAALFINQDIGTPLAYENHHNEIITNTHPDHDTDCKAIYVIVRENNFKTDYQIQKMIQKIH